MLDIILSKGALDSLKKMRPERSERIVAVLERIALRPQRHLRPLLKDPSFRLGTEEAFIYIDVSARHLIVLRIVDRGENGP